MQAETKKHWELNDHSLVDTYSILGRMFPANAIGCGWMVFYHEVERPADCDENFDWDYDYENEDVETGNWLKIFACIFREGNDYFAARQVMAQTEDNGSAVIENEEGPFYNYEDAYDFVVMNYVSGNEMYIRNLFKAILNDFD